MNITENMAQELIATYNSGDEGKTYQKAKELLGRFKRDQYLFTYAEHHYLMAKAFYCLFATINESIGQDGTSVVKLIYYHLMENYLKNADADASTPQYRDLLGGCQLGLVIMINYGQFIMDHILTGVCHIVPGYSQDRLFDQILLFNSIIDRAENVYNFHYVSDSLVDRDYQKVKKGLMKLSLKTADFDALKQRCNELIESNSLYIKLSFPIPVDYE